MSLQDTYICLYVVNCNSDVRLCLSLLLPKCLIFSETVVKKKWKYLRDQFAAELRKLPATRSGDAAGDNQTSKWHYFHLPHFLKDVMKPRASTGNFSSVLVSNAAKKPGSPQQEYQMGDIDLPLISEENMPASALHTQDIPMYKDELTDKHSLTSVPSNKKKKGASKRLKTGAVSTKLLRPTASALTNNDGRRRP